MLMMSSYFHMVTDFVMHVMSCISKFASISGLAPSLHKSNVYFGNCQPDFKVWIDSLYGLPHDDLPVKFLGVPLISSQLCINDCTPLINRIISRISSRTSLLLSLAGRIQLLRAVIFAINFIGQITLSFLLQCTKSFEPFLLGFYGKGMLILKVELRFLRTVCLPIEGGLGLKNTKDWNKAQISHHLCKIVTKHNSLWATWIC